jgi:hypothetical protein
VAPERPGHPCPVVLASAAGRLEPGGCACAVPSKARAIPPESSKHAPRTAESGIGARRRVKFTDSIRVGNRSGRRFGGVLFRDRFLQFHGRTVRQQKTAQAEFVPDLKPLKRPIDRAHPLQCAQQFFEIRFIHQDLASSRRHPSRHKYKLHL